MSLTIEPKLPYTAEKTPRFQRETYNVLRINGLTLPNQSDHYNFGWGVSRFESFEKKLQYAKEHTTRHKVLSSLAIGLSLSYIAGIALGTYFLTRTKAMPGAFFVLLGAPGVNALYFSVQFAANGTISVRRKELSKQYESVTRREEGKDFSE